MYFSCNVSFSSLPIFLTSIHAQLLLQVFLGIITLVLLLWYYYLWILLLWVLLLPGLTAPPYFLSFLTCIATT
jgi:hypothetical protein